MASITHLMGSDLRLYVFTGETYLTMDGELTFSMSETSDTHETTNKDSNYKKEFVYTNYTATFTVTGKLDQGDAVLEYLGSAMRNRNNVLVEIKTEDSDKFIGEALVTGVDRSAPFDGVVDVTINLQLTGDLTRTAAWL